MGKETLYKTCVFEGQRVDILQVLVGPWYQDGDSYMYRVRRIDGTNEIVHASECSEFAL